MTTEPAAGGPPPPSPDPAPAPEPEERRRRSFWRELPVLVVIAFAIALLIKSFLLQAFYIPSASMVPTLKEGDRVLVEKIGYRLGEPEPGDVVVFERDLSQLGQPDPEATFWDDISDAFKGLFGFPTGDSQDFIKRVVAIEGDTVEGRDGKIFVDGKALSEPYLPEGVTTSPFGPIDVGEGEIFVMGDNRSNSDDSRNYGPVPVDSVVGRAFVLVWPPADVAIL